MKKQSQIQIKARTEANKNHQAMQRSRMWLERVGPEKGGRSDPKGREGRVKGSGVSGIGQNRKRNWCRKGCETNSGAARGKVEIA
jgi:hypothetical protein